MQTFLQHYYTCMLKVIRSWWHDTAFWPSQPFLHFYHAMQLC